MLVIFAFVVGAVVVVSAFVSFSAVETEIGYVPKKEDLQLDGLDLSDETITELLSIDKAAWREDLANQREFFAQFGDKLPQEIKDSMDQLEKNLG